jgi:hypothetical protein
VRFAFRGGALSEYRDGIVKATKLLFTLIVVACADGAARERPAQAPSGAASPSAESCVLEPATRVEALGARYEVVASVYNPGTRSVSFELPDRCPAGPVDFSGLPAGYDYYGTCTQGACPGGRPAKRFDVGPGESFELARVEIDPAQSACNAALAPGRHVIGFSLPQAAEACSGNFAAIELGVAAPESTPATPPPG